MKQFSQFDPTDAGSVWDGLSLNTQRTSLNDNQGPDDRDYSQITAEVIKAEEVLADHETRLGSISGGAVPTATGLTGAETGAAVRQVTLTLAGVVLNTTDDATHGAFCSQEIYDFPEGNIYILGGVASLALLAGSGGLTDTSAIVGGIGTSTAAQSSGDGTLAAAEANIIPSTALTLSGGARAATALISTTPLMADGHSSAKKAYLNFQTPTAGSSATDTLTVTGTVTLNYIKLGDA